jgi:hypothetical protein
VLKALAAIHRAPLRRLEWNGCLFPALRTNRFCLYPLNASGARLTSLRAIGFAGFATLGFVLETLVCEKHLLAGGENEFRSAIGALQDLVLVFHALLRGPGSHGIDSGAVRSQRANEIPHVIAAFSRPLARS